VAGATWLIVMLSPAGAAAVAALARDHWVFERKMDRFCLLWCIMDPIQSSRYLA
jgi:hypothetical protein